MSLREVGRYIENIVDIAYIGIASTLWILFFQYIDNASVTSEIPVIFLYFVILFPTLLFNVDLKTDDYMTKSVVSYLAM